MAYAWAVSQAEILRDVARLTLYADSVGVDVTAGEFERPRMMQEYYVKTGRSKTMKSDHLYRRAADLYFFVREDNDLRLTYDVDELRPIVEYWKSLNPKNYWGGDEWPGFKDVPHFGRRR